VKVLNLYAGIGGNRKLWENVDVTAVELDPKIAEIYQDFFPNDKVIVADAHQYLLDHFKEFDFIWSSPPCPSHSRMRFGLGVGRGISKPVYPDMTLYQQILLLKHHCENKWLVENVKPYYKPLIIPTFDMYRHFFWCNFMMSAYKTDSLGTCVVLGEREFLQDEFGFDLSPYTGIDKRKALRNCVVPELGLHIFTSAFQEDKQLELL